MRNGWCRECAPTKDPIAPEVSKGKLRLSLPVQPMRKYIEKRIGQLGQGEFARRIDVPERSLRRILDESETIQLSLADKILTMDGSHLMYVYPELYE